MKIKIKINIKVTLKIKIRINRRNGNGYVDEDKKGTEGDNVDIDKTQVGDDYVDKDDGKDIDYFMNTDEDTNQIKTKIFCQRMMIAPPCVNQGKYRIFCCS